jgi:ribA/ribD-fused uncharacterized protein
MEPIREFRGEFAFLSNFFPSPILWCGLVHSTAEHLFQAAKTLDPAERDFIRHAATPGAAQRLGRKATLRPGWDQVKLQVMERVLKEKFIQNPDLIELLLATGERELIEGNYHGDSYWGVDLKQNPPAGENHLGRLLMELRARLVAA